MGGGIWCVLAHVTFRSAYGRPVPTGPIHSFSLLGQPVIVLSTAKVAADILDRLSLKTSDRPRLIKIGEHMCRNNEFALLPRNETWRIHRRAAHESLNVQAVLAMEPMQEEEAAILIEGFLKHPELPLLAHLHRLASSIPWRALFGHEYISLDGPNPTAPLDEFSETLFAAAVPGASIVDLMPFLNPLITRSKIIMSESNRFYEEATALFTKAFSDEQVDGMSSLSNNLKETWSKLGLMTAHECGWLGASLYLAAQETTATALRWFFLAMLLYPDTAVAARAELKAVVGDRPPRFADREALPQIEAMVKELLRWRPPAPTGVAHSATEDFTYGDYLIPKGAVIFSNIWSICRDPLLYADGDAFDPSRFIDEAGRVKQAPKDVHDDYPTFGYGRRICIGKNLAIQSLWITISHLLWAFDFKKGYDGQGLEVTPNACDFVDNGVTVYPKLFPVVLVPRFLDLEERIKASKLQLPTVA